MVHVLTPQWLPHPSKTDPLEHSMSPRWELVSLTTEDGLRLRGLFMPPQEGRTVVHVHGNSGNFYENTFLDSMANEYAKAGLGFLTFNNRGHDVIAEAYRSGKLCYIGAAVEHYLESVLDLQAAINFANQYSAFTFLQGHSFGCLKVLHFLLRSHQTINSILLSPADTLQLQKNFIRPETLENQIARLKHSLGSHTDLLLPHGEFGIREGESDYTIPIMARTFLELFEGDFSRVLSYTSPMQYYVDGAVFVYRGGSDPLLTASRQEIEHYFAARFRTVFLCNEEIGDHHMHRVEEKVAAQIAMWVAQTSAAAGK